MMLLPTVQRNFSANATGLAIFTLLSLGTFTAGVHLLSWQVCLLGLIMAFGIPVLAWVENSALFLLLIAAAVYRFRSRSLVALARAACAIAAPLLLTDPGTTLPARRSPGTVQALSEIFFDDPTIDRRQRHQILHRSGFVGLMHGLSDQSKFQHRAIVLDKTRVRGAAASRKFRLAAGDVGDRRDRELGKRAWLGDEYVGI
jgi:hypothetical protein